MRFSNGNGGAQTGTAATHEEDVVARRHGRRTLGITAG
jgi:hypothetical protein